MKILKSAVVISSLILASSAASAGWATGDCTAQSGTNIRYMVSQGNGYVFYNGDGPYKVFTEKKGSLGIINHIGNAGNMRMALDFDTGRGYVITRHDSGQIFEGNVICKLSYKQ